MFDLILIINLQCICYVFVKILFQFCMKLDILKIRTVDFFLNPVGSRLGFLGQAFRRYQPCRLICSYIG